MLVPKVIEVDLLTTASAPKFDKAVEAIPEPVPPFAIATTPVKIFAADDPVSPLIPVAPVAPCKPCNPVSPLIPCNPCVPVSPLAPRKPS